MRVATSVDESQLFPEGADESDRGKVPLWRTSRLPAGADEMTQIDSDTYREVMTRFPAGVTIITTFAEEQPYGLTVSAFTSVSLEPPIVLVCIDNASNTLPALMSSLTFTVNILHETSSHLALQFASKDASKFTDVEVEDASTGPILINDSTAYLGCRVTKAFEAGDHHVLLGKVEAGGVFDAQEPLIYCMRGFSRATPLDSERQS